MNYIHKRRLYGLGLLLLGLSLAAAFILYALQQNINVFLTPSQLKTMSLSSEDHLRLGGVVKVGSVRRAKDNLSMQFIITDFKQEVPVYFTGILPDLFREGKGVIAEGSIDNKGALRARQILAKHDENYMPKNVYEALKRQAA